MFEAGPELVEGLAWSARAGRCRVTGSVAAIYRGRADSVVAHRRRRAALWASGRPRLM